MAAQHVHVHGSRLRGPLARTTVLGSCRLLLSMDLRLLMDCSTSFLLMASCFAKLTRMNSGTATLLGGTTGTRGTPLFLGGGLRVVHGRHARMHTRAPAACACVTGAQARPCACGRAARAAARACMPCMRGAAAPT